MINKVSIRRDELDKVIAIISPSYGQNLPEHIECLLKTGTFLYPFVADLKFDLEGILDMSSASKVYGSDLNILDRINSLLEHELVHFEIGDKSILSK